MGVFLQIDWVAFGEEDWGELVNYARSTPKFLILHFSFSIPSNNILYFLLLFSDLKIIKKENIFKPKKLLFSSNFYRLR